jgi:hypothetical protein
MTTDDPRLDGWNARTIREGQAMTPDPRPDYVLRLTGEQIGSIDPPPEGDWFTDWDEYEDFVPRRMLAEARAQERERIAAAVRGLPTTFSQHTCWDDHEGGIDADGNPTLHADGSTCGDRIVRESVSRAAVLAALDGEK